MSSVSPNPEIQTFFDEPTNTASYVVWDPGTRHAAIIDSVLDFDYASGTIFYASADKIRDFVTAQKLEVDWHIETHVHADHLSAAPYLQETLGGKIGISEKIIEVQNVFGKIFNEGTRFQRNGTQFDHLFQDNEDYQIGTLIATALHTGAYTGLYGALYWQCCFCWRHIIHARWRHRTGGFSGRRLAPALSLHQAHSCPARQHTDFCLS